MDDCVDLDVLAGCAGADVNHSNAVVSVEHGNAVLRADSEPMSKRLTLAREQRMQDERRKREVIYPIHLSRNFKLLRIVAMDFDQDFHPKVVSLGRKRRDEAERLRDHETTCSLLLNCITHSVQPNHAYASSLKSA